MIRVSRLALFFVFSAFLAWTLDSAFAQEGKKEDVKEFKAPALLPIRDRLPGIFYQKSPESVSDLKAIQDHVDKVVERVIPTVVSVRVGASSGSGVIVTKDGYVLTAGHVSGKADRDVVVYFHDGKTAKGKTLGGNHGIDSGMIKITTEGDFPFAEMGDSSEMKAGHWCMVIAHPGGFKKGRAPVVRLGRMLNNDEKRSTLTTDAALVGGDSGGPLFDMHGRVVGINSRIGPALTANMHVPVNPFRDSWDKLAKGEVFGGKLGAAFAKDLPYMGVQTKPNTEGCVLLAVTPGSPADKAGLKADDVIKKLDDKELAAAIDLTKLVLARKAGDTIALEVLRGTEKLNIKVELGKR